jgi:hypothetical protein
VNDAWPPIRARLVALTAEVQASRASSIVVIGHKGAFPTSSAMADTSTKRVFLATLFNLLGIMSECSGEFIASRFRNDVFPLLGQLLGDFTVDSTASDFRHGGRSSKENLVSTGGQRQQSETLLITTMLRCLSVVFQEHACGRSLAGLVPSVGTLILPFLGDDHVETRDACMDAIRQMVRIDCDALWRPLVHLSRGGVASAKPWESLDDAPSGSKESKKLMVSTERSILECRASELVAFIESLPEQPLL